MKKLAILFCLFSLTIGEAQHQIHYKSTLVSFGDGHIQPEIDKEKVTVLPPSPTATLAPFKGSYAMNRYSYDDIFKIGKVAMGHIEVEVTEDGYLKTTLGENVYKWGQQDDLIFRHTESSEVLVFERDDKNNITHAFFGMIPTAALEKVEGVDTLLFHQTVFGISIITFLTTLGYWLFTYFSKSNNKIASNFPRNTKLLTVITLVIVLLFYIGVGTLLSRGQELIYGIPEYAYFLFSIPFLIIGLMSILFCQVIEIWTINSVVVFWKKGAFTFIWCCLIGSVFQWKYWNLIGFNF